MKNQLKIIALLALMLLLPGSMWSQYKLQRSTFGNGATASANTTHQLKGTVGQPAIGVTRHTTLRHQIGFWYQIPIPTSSVETISSDLPLEYRLEQNFPNPFNPATTIRFALRARGEVTVRIFDLLGREITTLLKEELPAGVHQLTFEATELPSGMYFYQLVTKEFLQTRKLLLVK